MSKFVLIFTTIALAAYAASGSHRINIVSPVTQGTTTIQPGEYKVSVQGDKAVFTKGKEVVEIPVTVEEGADKFKETQVNTLNPGAQLKEIKIGGTNVKMIFKTAPAASTTVGGGGQ